MRAIIQELYNIISGRDVFIIGGGNSLNNFDFTRLKGKNTIALNSAYKYLEKPTAVYWADDNWGAKNEVGLQQCETPFKFTSRINADGAIAKNQTGISGGHYLRKTGDMGYDPCIDNVRGNNSGGNAINFMINLNAARIILLGFDMGYVNGRTHFHEHHEQSVALSTYNEMFIPSINSLAKAVTHLPVKIINCNRQSNLKCFEFGDIEDYI